MTQQKQQTQQAQKKENPFYNILFNIILPVLILNKGKDFFPAEDAAVYSLLLALAFPFIYGCKDYIVSKKINIISLIGVIGVALTGGLALLQLKGIYFAIKEAIIPLFIAIVVLGSIPYKKPLISLFLFQSSLFKKDLIYEKLKEHNKEKEFQMLMNKTTIWLAGSFLLSALLNFIIGLIVFKNINPDLKEAVQRQILNEQIADMTWMGYVFIAFPLSFITIFILWYILKHLKQMTGLDFKESIQQ